MKMYQNEKKTFQYEYSPVEIVKNENPESKDVYSITFNRFPKQIHSMTVHHMTLDDLKSIHQLIGEIISEEGGRS